MPRFGIPIEGGEVQVSMPTRPTEETIEAFKALGRALNEKIDTCHERVACPTCGAVVGDRCHRKGALYLPGYKGYAAPAWLKHPHDARWQQEVPPR